MAIDTAEKRKSISGIWWFMPVGVTPEAAMDAEWRQEAGWGYPGIAASTPAVPPALVLRTLVGTGL